MKDLRRELIGRRPGNVDTAIRALGVAEVPLPDEVTTANRALLAIAEGRRQRRAVKAVPTPEDDAERILAAAQAGQPLPDDLTERGTDAYLARQAAEHAERAWHVAADRALGNRDMAFNRAGLGLYAALGDRLNEVLAEAGKVVAGLGGAGLDPATLARDKRAQAAYPRLASLAAEYQAVRAAQVQLRPFLGHPNDDVNEWYAEVRSPQALMGAERWATHRTNLDATLGPPDPVERLRWLVGGKAEPWLPEPQDQDQALAAETATMHAHREAEFRRRQGEAAARGETLVREGPTPQEWRAAELAARQRAEAQRSR